MNKTVFLTLAATSASLALAGAASAATNLVTNGGFESTSAGNGQVSFNTSLTGWSLAAPNDSYTFVYAPGTADTSGSQNQYGGPTTIWGPGNGVNNGLPAASPDGGNFIAADPSYDNNSPLSQTIDGLKAGGLYKVTFDWAAAQQYGFDGSTSEGWTVNLGSGPSQSTTAAAISNHGFSGWKTASFIFQADGASDVLSFLSFANPSTGAPPFALLDGVSLTAVPEPAAWAIMLVGFGGIGAAIRARRKQAAATA